MFSNHSFSSEDSVRTCTVSKDDFLAVSGVAITCPWWPSGTQKPVMGSGLYHCWFVGWGGSLMFVNLFL